MNMNEEEARYEKEGQEVFLTKREAEEIFGIGMTKESLIIRESDPENWQMRKCNEPLGSTPILNEKLERAVQNLLEVEKRRHNIRLWIINAIHYRLDRIPEDLLQQIEMALRL